MSPHALTIIDPKTVIAARRATVWQRLLVTEAKEARQDREDRLACEREVPRG